MSTWSMKLLVPIGFPCSSVLSVSPKSIKRYVTAKTPATAEWMINPKVVSCASSAIDERCTTTSSAFTSTRPAGLMKTPSRPARAVRACPSATGRAPIGSSIGKQHSLAGTGSSCAARGLYGKRMASAIKRLKRLSLINQHDWNAVANFISQLAFVTNELRLLFAILELAFALRANQNLQQLRIDHCLPPNFSPCLEPRNRGNEATPAYCANPASASPTDRDTPVRPVTVRSSLARPAPARECLPPAFQ